MKIYNENIQREIDLEELFDKYKISIGLNDVIAIYDDYMRFYHTFEHIVTLLKDIKIDDDRLIMAIVFHDIEFNVKIETYKEISAKFFEDHCEFDDSFVRVVREIILASKDIEHDEGMLESEIVRVDRKILHSKDINTLLTWERQIFKEYQNLSINEYKEARTSFLTRAYKETGNSILIELRDIIKNKVYKIGFYPGSFNPFHIGHHNILLKAEKSFDKVVIGVGINYDKKDITKVEIPRLISNREVITYSGLITSEIEALNLQGEVFIVRGLRNAYDLQHEEGLRNVIKDFLPEQEFVYFFCNKEYEHISSSLIRDIQSRRGESEKADRMVKRYCLD